MRHTILFLTMQICTCGRRSLQTSVPSVGNARPSFMSSMHAILRRYIERHDLVLTELYHFTKQHLSPSISVAADLEEYCFPQRIVATDLRPDIVCNCWDEAQKRVWLMELTVCYEACFQAAADRKERKYLDLANSTESAGFTTQIITVEVGSRGLLNPTGFDELATAFKIKDNDMRTLMTTLSRVAFLGSHRIWCRCNRQNT